MGIDAIVNDFISWAGPNGVIEKKDPKEKAKYEELKAADPKDTGKITLENYLKYVQKTQPSLRKMLFLQDQYYSNQYTGICLTKECRQDDIKNKIDYIKGNGLHNEGIFSTALNKLSYAIEISQTLLGVEFLHEALTDTGHIQSVIAALALGRAGDNSASPVLQHFIKMYIKAVHNAKYNTKKYVVAMDTFNDYAKVAVDNLGILKDQSAVPTLLSIINDKEILLKHDEIYRKAVNSLKELDLPATITALKNMMAANDDDQAKVIIADLLAQCGDISVLNFLEDRYGKGDMSVIRSIAYIKDNGAVSFLANNNKEAYRFIEVWSHTKNEKAVPQLIKYLDSDENGERAAEALGEIGDRSAIPYLRAAMEKSKEQYMRLVCAVALGKLGDKKITPVLRDIILDINGDGGDDAFCVEIMEGLKKIGTSDAAKILVEVMQKQHYIFVRTEAAKALGDFKVDPSIRELVNNTLVDAVYNDTFDVAMAASKSLKNLKANNK